MPSELLELPARAEAVEEGPPPADAHGSVEYPERLLLGRLKRGDAAAFEMLVKAHQDRVYDFCVRMLGDREEAFDLTQEIFISIHQHLDQFRAGREAVDVDLSHQPQPLPQSFEVPEAARPGALRRVR